jgi:trimeric autotransporter adhesin
LSNTADENTATGAGALFSHTDGVGNTANGGFALFLDTSGVQNMAVGDRALFLHTAGNFNTAIGAGALLNDDTGSNNVAVGLQALGNNISGSSNIALGNLAGVGVTTASNVICIYAGGANVDNSCYIGNIWNRSVDPGSAMSTFVDGSGKLGTVASSRHFKHEIKPMAKASEAILALKPVTFHYKSDSKGTPQFGLVAEEVADVNPDLVVRDKNGEILTVRYEAVNAMLLNEFLKEHQRVQEQTKEIDALKAELKEQRDLVQKVSDKLEVSTAKSQVAVSNP